MKTLIIFMGMLLVGNVAFVAVRLWATRKDEPSEYRNRKDYWS